MDKDFSFFLQYFAQGISAMLIFVCKIVCVCVFMYTTPLLVNMRNQKVNDRLISYLICGAINVGL